MARPVRPLPLAAAAARRVSVVPGCRVGVGEGQRGLVVGQGLGRAAHPAGGVTGEHRCLEGDRAVARGEGVSCEVGRGAQAGVGPQRLDAGPVQLRAARRAAGRR